MVKEHDSNKWRDLAEKETEATVAPMTENTKKADDEHLLNQEPHTVEKDQLDKIHLLEKEVLLLKDQIARTHAEAQNTQRRLEQEASKARKFAVDRLLSDLVPLVESLEHALEVQASDHAQLTTMREGIQLTLDMLLKLLEKNGVVSISPKPGDPFDPTQHEAMSMQPHPEFKSNTIAQILRKGYALHGRVIKAAMVMVAQ
ncbi:MAG: nucleotide exchange factor GrpE [Gammaproteobacteria bacterium RIFCSPHIGHO2_12_FULL_42_13]|nr:MAG: nucleotide exchange factor GrpE [Gammaproteobacteria bacterium RIFCSPHIGHO2_12_FULL_42_13]